MADFFSSDMPLDNADAQNSAQRAEKNAQYLQQALESVGQLQSSVYQAENVGYNPEREYLAVTSQQRGRGPVGGYRKAGIEGAIRADIGSRLGMPSNLDVNRQYAAGTPEAEYVSEYQREKGIFAPMGRAERKAAAQKLNEDYQFFEQLKQGDKEYFGMLNAMGLQFDPSGQAGGGGGGGGGCHYEGLSTPQRPSGMSDPNAQLSWSDYSAAYNRLSGGQQAAFRESPWALRPQAQATPASQNTTAMLDNVPQSLYTENTYTPAPTTDDYETDVDYGYTV
jgi:hypothetical protein